jgi:hypothetical protein
MPAIDTLPSIRPTFQARRLTLLAPDIIEVILDGRQPAELQLDDLLRRFPVVLAARADTLVTAPATAS